MNTQVEILVNGKPVKQYRHEGKSFIEARVNTEYSIKIKNSSYGRKLAVITVDGLNVITGKPHTDNTVGEGYIVNGNDAIEIKGFRKDMKSVGAFKFCQAGHSYCNERGLKGNNGVIGVRIYDEVVEPTILKRIWDNIPAKPDYPEPEPYKPFGKPDYPEPEPYKPFGPLKWHDTTITCSNNTADSEQVFGSNTLNYCSTQGSVGGVLRSCSVSNNAKSAPNFDVGTTWGKQINDSAVTVSFNCSTTYEEYIIYYDSRKNLEKMGIKFKKETEVCYPKAFGVFATPPRGWTGK